MKTPLLVICIFLATTFKAQVIGVDTINYKGNSNNYINIVVLGDGYVASQQSAFITDATNLTGYLMAQSPWNRYVNYFNVFAVKIISAQSGAKHPNTAPDCGNIAPVLNPTTFLGCSFDLGNIHRLLAPTNYTNLTTASSAFPNYDQLLCISNTPYYGGSGGSYATSSLHSSSPEVMAHEVGHSFGKLADEYFQNAYEAPNMTQQNNPTLIKWKNWIGVNGVGINAYCCGGTSSTWFKPTTGCKMQFLNSAYCSVCQQAIIEEIHNLVNPLVAYTPTNNFIPAGSQPITFKLTELMKPSPNTLRIEWKVNGNVVLRNADSLKINPNSLQNGNNSINVTIEDTVTLLKVDMHSSLHMSAVGWTVNRGITGIKVNAIENRLHFSLSPNPTSQKITMYLENDKATDMTYNIISDDGKLVQKGTEKLEPGARFEKDLNVQDLPNGIYSVVVIVNGNQQNLRFIKQ